MMASKERALAGKHDIAHVRKLDLRIKKSLQVYNKGMKKGDSPYATSSTARTKDFIGHESREETCYPHSLPSAVQSENHASAVVATCDARREAGPYRTVPHLAAVRGGGAARRHEGV